MQRRCDPSGVLPGAPHSVADLPTRAGRGNRGSKGRPKGLGRGLRASWILACLLPALVGCRATRTLKITSDPPGAEVRLDDRLVGKTPLEIPFLHYGTRRVTFYLEDHLTTSRIVDLEPEWYAAFPADYLSEVIVPVGTTYEKALHVELEHGSRGIGDEDLQSVLLRAESLRHAGPSGPKLPKVTPEPDESSTSVADDGVRP